MYFTTSQTAIPHQASQLMPIMRNIHRILSDKLANRLGVKQINFIYRYLNSIPIMERNGNRLLYMLQRSGEELREYEKLFGLWSDLRTGDIKTDVFYKDTPEIFISTNSVSVVNSKPIRVLYCQEMDSYIPSEPDGSVSINGSVVYLINLPAIALSYSDWYNSRKEYKDDILDVSVTRFIRTKLYPVLLQSIMEMSIFNIWAIYGFTELLPEFENYYNFSLPNPNNKFLEWTKAYYKKNNSSKKLYGDYLKQIPLLYAGDYYDAVEKVDIYESDSLRPILVPVYMYYYNTLSSLFPEAKNVNTFTSNKVKLSIRLLRNSRSRHIFDSLPEDLRFNVLF